MTGHTTKQSLDALRELEANLELFLRDEQQAAQARARDGVENTDLAEAAQVDAGPVRSDPVTSDPVAPPTAAFVEPQENFDRSFDQTFDGKLDIVPDSALAELLAAPKVRPEPARLSDVVSAESSTAPEVRPEPIRLHDAAMHDAGQYEALAARPSNAPEVTLAPVRADAALPEALKAPEVTLQSVRPDAAVESSTAPEVKPQLARMPDAVKAASARRVLVTKVAPVTPGSAKPATKKSTSARSSALRVWRRRARNVVVVAVPVLGVVVLAMAALWWRLMSGPIAIDIATPWITAAIAENFGGEHRVEIGGTQLERDENGRPRLRILDIVVRDADGTVVASAPKAEVAVSGTSLLTSRIRAERLSLVGAEMAVRIETDGQVTVFAGADKTRPIATASADSVRRGGPALAALPPATAEVPGAPAGSTPAASPIAAPMGRNAIPNVTAMLSWIDGLGASGLDGHDLSELGLKNGSLVVDDRRTGKQWNFEKIDLSLTRAKNGGLGFSVSSDDRSNPWRLKIGFTPAPNGNRMLAIEAEKVSLKDILLALRIGEGQYEANIPLNARILAEIGSDGVPVAIEGRIISENGGGSISHLAGIQQPVAIDAFETTISWDRARGSMIAPFQIVSGGNRITLYAQIDVPADGNSAWIARLTGGTVVLASLASNPQESQSAAQDQIVFNRFLLRLRIDPDKRRVDVEQGEVGNTEFGIALSGSVDYSEASPRIALGVAGNRMPFGTMKRLWPAFLNPGLRDWVIDHVRGATVDRVVIATNASMQSLAGDPNFPMTADGLSVEVGGTNATLAPVDGLPQIREADFEVRATGRTASLAVKRGVIEMSAGRKLTLTDGMFEVPNTWMLSPPARLRFKMDGPVAAAAELLALPAMQDASGGIPLDPATSRGNINGQVNIGVTLNSDPAKTPMTYAIAVDLTNFAADRVLLGQKLEAASLRVNATQTGYQAKGDVKLGGIPVTIDYKKQRSDAEAEIRIQGNLDEAARNRLGFQVGTAIVGAVPVRMTGRIPANEQESRFAVDADLGPVKIENLLPGWQKAAGKPARATFNLYKFAQSSRFEDISVDGSGALVRGSVEVDAGGDVLSANFPVFSLSDGDKTALKVDRATDGTLRVTMRGDIYDGRAFVKGMVAGSSNEKNAQPAKDVDLDIKIGTVAGHHGETMRGLDLKMSRRNGVIRNFALSGKLGRDAALLGDLRGRPVSRQVLYIETADAGALFRFTDTYARIQGGDLQVSMDPPGANQAPLDGILTVRNFAVRGEAALDSVASSGTSGRNGVEFSSMRVDFTKTPGKFTVRDGVVRGPVIGATIDGVLDYQTNEVHMRGSFVPLYSLNNMFGQIPIVGLILGGGTNEGLVGITYEVVGTPTAPILRVNPISAIAPGLLRKFFEFPTSAPQSYADPVRP